MLVERLVAAPPLVVDIQGELMKTLFMKPIGTTSAMKMGSANESNIADAIGAFLEANSPSAQTNSRRFCLTSICEVGLVSNNQAPSLATSVDRLCSLSISTPPQHPHCDDEGAGEPVAMMEQHFSAVEIKCLSTTNTERQGLQRISGFPERSRLVITKFGSELFKRLVWTMGYRCQVFNPFHCVLEALQ